MALKFAQSQEKQVREIHKELTRSAQGYQSEGLRKLMNEQMFDTLQRNYARTPPRTQAQADAYDERQRIIAEQVARINALRIKQNQQYQKQQKDQKGQKKQTKELTLGSKLALKRAAKKAAVI